MCFIAEGLNCPSARGPACGVRDAERGAAWDHLLCSPRPPPLMGASRGRRGAGGTEPLGCLVQPTLGQSFGENKAKWCVSPVPLRRSRGGGGSGKARAAGSARPSTGELRGKAAVLGPLIKSLFPKCHLKRVVVMLSHYQPFACTITTGKKIKNQYRNR